MENKVAELLLKEQKQAVEQVAALKKRLCDIEAFSTLNAEQREQLTRPFDEFCVSIEKQKLIAVIRETLRNFEKNEYPQALERLTAWTEPKPATAPNETAEPPAYVPCSSLNVAFNKPWLANEADVERYLQAMREALLEEIRKGKRIRV